MTNEKQMLTGGQSAGVQPDCHTRSFADCSKRFSDSPKMPFGGFPMPKRKVGITISGLEQWKGAILCGAEVRVDLLQNGKCIHSEVFSGKATNEFTRVVSVNASFDELVTVHNRPDLPALKVSAAFMEPQAGTFSVSNGQVFINDAGGQCRMTVGINKEYSDDDAKLRAKIEDIIERALQPGGLLHKR